MEEFEILKLTADYIPDTWQLLIRFAFNTAFVWLIIQFFYYRKSRRANYYFTFALISISVFLLTFLLGGVRIKLGMALGLFAIFGIIRYRTEVLPVREMTYLFMIISMSVINALSVSLGYVELLITNCLFLLAAWVFESARTGKKIGCKTVLYDKIENIRPDRREQLIADLTERTGLRITDVEIGSIDFLKDSTMLRVFYETSGKEWNAADSMLKLPREEER